jgi:hypothetical protein
MTALSLPFEPQTAPPAPRFWRLVRETSRRAWYVVRERLPRRERAVYFGLMAYWNAKQHWPTSQELLEFLLELKRRNPRHPRYRLIIDANSVRPRLTGLNQYDPPLVVTRATDRRLCQSQRAREARQLLVGRSTMEVSVYRIPQVGE